ncbi:glycosyltransferase [Microvirga sp. GCM10011540]|uniref:glycosyltransferase n=1 Tax=Microvirga sp. GCM10011540 TaxID=3317338 RepID=UPI00361F8D12
MSERKVKVLVFIPALVPGGAERVTATLLRNLSRSRFDVSLAVVNQQNSVFADELPADIPVTDLKAPRLRYALHRIVRHIWQVRPDVVFSTIDYFNVALGSTRHFWPRHTRFIARPTILFSAALERNRQPILWRMLSRIALFNTDLMIFQSPEMEQDYRKSLNWFGGAAAVIPNPLDFAFVRERAASGSDEPNYDPSIFNLVAAGRLEDQKGFDSAIEAIALARNKDLHLTILGEGSLRQSLEDQARRMGVEERVRLIGYRHNPYPYYAQADGFLLSSRFEGFPNVVLEALSCGTPVVATPVAGLAPILENIPQCEITADHTPSSIAEAIDKFRSRAHQRVSADVVSQFDVRQVVLKYEELFDARSFALRGVGRGWSLAQ